MIGYLLGMSLMVFFIFIPSYFGGKAYVELGAVNVKLKLLQDDCEYYKEQLRLQELRIRFLEER